MQVDLSKLHLHLFNLEEHVFNISVNNEDPIPMFSINPNVAKVEDAVDPRRQG